MNTPNLYTPHEFKNWDTQAQVGKGWFPARPLGWQGPCLRKRFYFAWMVFTGRWDALQWYGQTGPVTRNPHTGEKRHPLDIESDPHALGAAKPGPLCAAINSKGAEG